MIRVTKTTRGSHNGFDSALYLEGVIYSLETSPPMSDSLARNAITNGWGEAYDPREDAKVVEPREDGKDADDPGTAEGGEQDTAPEGESAQGQSEESTEDADPDAELLKELEQYHLGSGWYELPWETSKIQGKANALESLKANKAKEA